MSEFRKLVISNVPNFIGFVVLAYVQNENAVRTHELLLRCIASGSLIK